MWYKWGILTRMGKIQYIVVDGTFVPEHHINDGFLDSKHSNILLSILKTLTLPKECVSSCVM